MKRKKTKKIPWWLLLFLALPPCMVDDDSARPCERLQHHDSAGHVVLCDCSCSDDPRFACPPIVVECERPELLDEGTSSSDG